MESLSNAPVLILRSNNKNFKAKQKQLQQRVRTRKGLRQEIYSNHSIFSSNVDLYRNMAAQTIIWDRNFHSKCAINAVKEQNSALRAKIWNIEKENRRMERQLDNWHLRQLPAAPRCSGQAQVRPYVDVGTAEIVLSDQDYQIVSLKMTLFDLEQQLGQLDEQLSRLTARNQDTINIARVLNHQIACRRLQVYEHTGPSLQENPKLLPSRQEKLAAEMMRQSQHLEVILKNTELKKKSKAATLSELSSLQSELQVIGQSRQAQIELLKAETRSMRLQQDGGLQMWRQKLRLSQQQTRSFECLMQQSMDKLIAAKIPLQVEIASLMEKASSTSLNQ